MNVAGVTGRLVKVPEFKFQNNDNGKPFCLITIAADKPLSVAKQKELEERGEPTADFFDVACYDYAAQFLQKQLSEGRIKAGSLLEVTGRLEQRRWTTPQGEKRSAVGLRAREVNVVQGRERRAAEDRKEPTDVRKEPTSDRGSVQGNNFPESDFRESYLERSRHRSRTTADQLGGAPETFGDRYNPFLKGNDVNPGGEPNPFLGMVDIGLKRTGD